MHKRSYQGTPQRPLRRYVTAPDGWDATWRAAKAASETTPCWLGVIGDSISSGVKASDFVANGFPGLLKTALKARGHSWYADFWPVSYANAVSSPGGYTWAGTAPWSYTLSGNLVHSAGGYYKHLVWIGAGTNPAYDVATFTTPYATTKIELVYHPGGIQSGWGAKVDGGTAVNVTDAFDGYTKKTDLGTLADSTHTVTIGNILAQFRFTLSGATTYEDATKGIGLARLGGLGAQVKDWINTGGQPSNIPRQLQGFYSGGTTGFGFPMQPHLAVIELGANDCHVGNTVAEVREGLIRLISAARRGREDCSVLFVIPCYPDGVSSDVTTTLDNPFTWSQYTNVVYEVANHFNCAVVNIHAKWGETPVADGLCTSSIDLHPTDAGMADIADAILAVI